MNIFNPQRLPGICFIFVVIALSSITLASASNKWRVHFSESAHSDGVITFEIAPEGSAAFQVSVEIADETHENQVAQTVADTLVAQLPANKFHVEVDDGEDVLIKKRLGTEDFGLRLLSNTVESVLINLDRE